MCSAGVPSAAQSLSMKQGSACAREGLRIQEAQDMRSNAAAAARPVQRTQRTCGRFGSRLLMAHRSCVRIAKMRRPWNAKSSSHRLATVGGGDSARRNTRTCPVVLSC